MVSVDRYVALTFIVLVVASGCGPAPSSPSSSTSPLSQSVGLASEYLLTEEPVGAVPVGKARATLEDGQQVVLVGTIGGSSQPFVDGLAAFTIVDPDVPYCAPDEGCPTPWDYCCTQDQVKDNLATVKIVDDSGAPVAANAKDLLGVQELSTVVVAGTAQRDEQGNLSLAARQVFLRP